LIFARLQRTVSQLPTGGHEIHAINVLNKSNDITALLAVTAIPDLFLAIDCETIIAGAAFWAWAYSLGATFPKFDAAPRALVLDPYKARALDDWVQGRRGGAHAAFSRRSCKADSAALRS
jgi:hypothetical protein